ncbi:PAS domain-containing protein [Methylobacterium sp. J-043]|nr:PAS domain-containing protein [Methylobacterium sp. J-043]
MNAADFSFSSSDFLQLLESIGLTGTWGWTFATGEQVWSPGLFRMLGLAVGETTPSYERLIQFVHPEDQDRLERPDDVRVEGMLGAHTVRVLRPDGVLRILSLRGTVYHTPEGRPRAAAGIVLDVTDREQMAASLRMERRRQWALFEVLQSWSNAALYVGGQRTASPEILSLTGVSQDVFKADCDRIVAPDDRARMRAHIQAMIAEGKSFEVSKRLLMADGDQGQFRFLYTPVRDAEGRTETWATYASRLGGPKAPVIDQVRRGLVQSIDSSHLRAARALLGWSMQDLAQAGGLSFATVRRLEENAGGRRAHSHERAVAALQRAGIGFQIVEGNRIAVFRR